LTKPKSLREDLVRRIQSLSKNLSWLPLVALVILLLNLWSVQDDIWDGVIYAYANDVGDLRGWLRLADQSGWELVVPIILLAEALGGILGANYFVGYKLIASFSLAILTHEVFRFLRDTVQVPTPWPALGSALAISSSVWTAAAGAAMVWHVVAPSLALVAIRLVYAQGKRGMQLLGFALLVLSFTLHSIVAFAPALALIYELSKRRDNSLLTKWSSYWRLFAIGISGPVYLILQSIYNPKYGRYADYNQLDGLLTWTRLLQIMEASFWFVSFASFLFFVVICVLLLKADKETRSLQTLKTVTKDRFVIASFVLVIASAAPYIAVGKAPIFFQVWDWQGRNGFLFALALAVLAAAVLPRITSVHEPGLRNIAILLIVLVSIASSLVQTLGFQYKVERNEFDQLLVKRLSVLLPSVKEGYVRVETFGGPVFGHPVGHQLDLQYLIFKSAGDAKWLTTGELNSHLSPPHPRFEDEVDRLTDIYSGNRLKCTTELNILGRGWGMPFGPLLRFVINRESPDISVSVSAPLCKQ